MSDINLNIYHHDDETKGIYLLGSDLRDIFGFCDYDIENAGKVIQFILKKKIKMLNEIDKTKFPKRGVLFYMSEIRESHKWYV